MSHEPSVSGRGKWMALAAALLGWMFDGLEMGLFPLVARPALADLLGITDDSQIGLWFAVITAGFLVGAATGGVLFGWLGDRIGRVRAMTLSVFTYAFFSGLCGVAANAHQVTVFRFIAALGMGGEWSLGVALVMEIWPNRSRALMAGLIGAAANLGYMIIAVIGLGLNTIIGDLQQGLLDVGVSPAWVEYLTAHGGWRILMLLGATPALLTFLIRLFVPESERWEHEQKSAATSHWAAVDLLGVLIGSLGSCGIIYLWFDDGISTAVRLIGTVVGLAVAIVGYTYPVLRFLQRSGDVEGEHGTRPTMRRMLLAACLSGVALLGTWGSIQWASVWADELAHKLPEAKAATQISSAFGAVVGTIVAALVAGWLGRRITYTMLCLASLISCFVFYQGNTEYGTPFLICAFFGGFCTASFYGWLPLYLPELFRTRVRATGQGFGFNFGRILAAVGVMQTGNLTKMFQQGDTTIASVATSLHLPNTTGYPLACSTMSLIYLVGMVLIWFAPETKGKPLPE